VHPIKASWTSLGGLLCAAVLLLGLGLPSALGAPPRHYIGAPWEEGIERGVEGQRSALRRGTTPENILGRAQRAVRRDASVVKLYLLARAHGLRASVELGRAQEVKDPAVQRRQREKADADFSEALSIYAEVLRKAPNCYFALHDMGVLELQRNPKATRVAYDYFSRGYRINAKYTPTQRQIIQLFLAGKQYEEAISVILRVIDLDPADQDARLRLVSCYANIQKYDLAYEVLDPMVDQAPADLRLLAMRAHLDLKTKRFVRAALTYRRLARANPNVPAAFMGMIEALQDPGAQKEIPTAMEDYLSALKGLRRLERNPENLKRIDDDIAKMEHRLSSPDSTTAGGPPGTEELLHALNGPDAELRWRSVVYLTVRDEKANADVLRAIAAHIAPAAETDPRVRGAAVSGLARLAGTSLLPVVRLGLQDPSENVRAMTADQLVGIAARDQEAAGPVISILGLHVNDEAPEVATAARNGILVLSGVTLAGVGDESSDADWRRAFSQWWAGTEGADVLIRSLEKYPSSGDRNADDVLLPYLSSPDFYVFRGAYNGLRGSTELISGDARVRWFQSMPQFDAVRLKKANHGALQAEMAAWAARRPGA
jgi:tetratricopeptide (TPR) repeat protein